MNITLTITASADVLVRILASLPDDMDVAVPNDPSTSTGTGTPDDRAFSPSLPNSVAPIQPAPFPPMQPISTSSPDDEDGDFEATGETDSNGLPWDERIHASTRTQTQKGEWKKRKGADPAEIKRVEAELRARNAPPIPLPSGVPAPTPAPLPMMPVPQMGNGAVGMTPPLPMPTAAQVMPTPVPVMPVAQPEPTPQPVASAVPESVDVMTLMTKIATGQTAGTISAEYIADLTQRVAQAYQTPLNAVTDMLARPEMLTYTAQLMAQDGKW